MVSLFEAFVLSVIQGISEWLPISSSGHLAIFHNIFGFQKIEYDVFLHFASIFALIIIFYKDIIKILNFKKKENRGYLFLILVAILPAAILGYFLHDLVEKTFSSFIFLGIFFILSGIVIFSTKFFKIQNRKINFFDALFIGLFQALAIFPGISRSGTTISAGIFRKIEKKENIKFVFFISIPIILGASFFEFRNLNFNEISFFILLFSFLVTFLVSLVSIKLLIKFLNHDNFYLFGFYNFILGLIIMIYYFIIK